MESVNDPQPYWKRFKGLIVGGVVFLILMSTLGDKDEGSTGPISENGVRSSVEEYITARAYNPGSYQSIGWDIRKNQDGSYDIRHQFNVKNMSGDDESKEMITCTVGQDGSISGVRIWPDPTLGHISYH